MGSNSIDQYVSELKDSLKNISKLGHNEIQRRWLVGMDKIIGNSELDESRLEEYYGGMLHEHSKFTKLISFNLINHFKESLDKIFSIYLPVNDQYNLKIQLIKQYDFVKYFEFFKTPHYKTKENLPLISVHSSVNLENMFKPEEPLFYDNFISIVHLLKYPPKEFPKTVEESYIIIKDLIKETKTD